MARRPALVPVRIFRVVVGGRRSGAGGCGLSPHRASGARDRSSAGTGHRRLRPRARHQRCDRGIAPVHAAGDAAAGTRRCIGRGSRTRPFQAPRLQWRHARPARSVRGRIFAVFGHVLVAADGARRRRHRRDADAATPPRRGARGPQARRAGLRRARGDRAGEARNRRARTGGRRAGIGRGPEIRTRRQGEAAAVVRRHAGFAVAAARTPRRSAVDAGSGQLGNARIHVALDRAQARRFRRRGSGAGCVSRPRHHALRDRAGCRREGRADRQPHEGSGARAVGGVDPRRGDDPRQVVHGPRVAQRETTDRQADRDPLLGHVQRQCECADTRPWQGHRGQAGHCRSRAHAAPARRRHHGFRQVGRRQRDDPVVALQGGAEAGSARAGRPEDAGALGLRGDSASARAGGDRHEARRQRIELVRRGDGAPLPADVHARRAQPVRLQRQGRSRRRRRASRSPIRSRSRPTTRSRSRRCPTSSS